MAGKLFRAKLVPIVYTSDALLLFNFANSEKARIMYCMYEDDNVIMHLTSQALVIM